MGACVSKQQHVVVPSTTKATVLDEKPVQGPGVAESGQDVAQQHTGDASEQLDSTPYPGSIAPVCELDRRQHLLDLNILHTAPEPRFDDITKLASMVFKVPIALVSLVDEKIQWFKSVQGLPVDNTPRNTSFCAWTLLPAYPEALVVEDAQQDARFKDNPLVTGAPFIRFYAGCPLVCSNGMRLGSLCIIDKVPRSFDAESCNMLANMAEMVIREIEREKVLEEQRLQQERKNEEHKQLLRAIDCFNDAIMMLDMSTDDWSVVFSNEAWDKLVGCSRAPGVQMPFWDVFQLPPTNSGHSGMQTQSEFTAAVAAQQNFELLLTFTTTQNSINGRSHAGVQYASAQFRCAANTGLDSHMPLIGIPNFLPNSERASKFYFATLKPMQPPSTGREPAGGASGQAVRSIVPGAAPHFSIMRTNEPFQDIKLGPLLGKGAFGRVYRGVWGANTVVAVKVIEYPQDKNKDGTLLEGILSQQVQHPNVVRTYKHMTRPLAMATRNDYEDEGGHGLSSTVHPPTTSKGQLMETWLLLEFCNRGSVSDAVDKGWFRKRGSSNHPNMYAILATAREMASALCYLHSHNILHGDLTGNNVLLTASPSDKQRPFTAKVSDFGLSRLISSDAPVIETRTYGTVTHMPPELLMHGVMSRAVDVYSFGVVCWEMYCGHRPYGGMSHSQVLHSVGQNGAMLQLPPGTPPAFNSFVAACLERDPKKRLTMDQVLQQLQAMEAML